MPRELIIGRTISKNEEALVAGGGGDEPGMQQHTRVVPERNPGPAVLKVTAQFLSRCVPQELISPPNVCCDNTCSNLFSS